MAKKKKRNISRTGCENCSNCIPIGEGDHICTECGEPKMVICEYMPTDEYNACNGRKFCDW